MPTIKFVNEKKSIEVEPGTNLRRAAVREGIKLSGRVHITKGMENVSPKTLGERLRLMFGPISFLARLGHEHELRIASKVRVNGDIEVQSNAAVNWHGEKFWG